MRSDTIYIQLGTRLFALVYKSEGEYWEVWTSANRRDGDSNQWHGTYTEIRKDGSAETIHRLPNMEEKRYKVR
jgi:hypothetical protein